MNKDFAERLSIIQKELNAPKGQWNDFSNFYYRSCEDILEGVKPILKGLLLTVDDEVVIVGERYYIKATYTITDGENYKSASAFAREPLSKKGMDESQISGTASSYARKYALNGLFCINDEKDADSKDNRATNKQQPPKQNNSKQQNKKATNDDNKTWYSDDLYNQHLELITSKIRDGQTPYEVVTEMRLEFKVANKYFDLIEKI